MKKVQIQWGDLTRTEAIESEVWSRSEKILELAPMATTLNVNLRVINSLHSAGVATQSVNMELRLPNKHDVRTQKEGSDLYKVIKEAQLAILTQLKAKKDKGLV